MVKHLLFYVIAVVLILTIAACGDDAPGDEPDATESTAESPAADAVEAYLNAKVASDEAGIQRYLCSDLEAELQREVNSFKTVSEAGIDNMYCVLDDGGETVTCMGEIVAVYGDDPRTFDLTTYRVVEEGGEWKWCGEAEAPGAN